MRASSPRTPECPSRHLVRPRAGGTQHTRVGGEAEVKETRGEGQSPSPAAREPAQNRRREDQGPPKRRGEEERGNRDPGAGEEAAGREETRRDTQKQ